MKKYLKIGLLLCLPVFAKAQPGKQMDSAYLLLQHAKNDTVRMNAFLILSRLYDDVNADSGIYYSNKGMAVADKLGSPLHKAEFLALLSFPLMKTGNYPEALRVITQGLKIAEAGSGENKKETLQNGPASEKYRLTVVGLLYTGLEYLYLFVGNYEKQIGTAHEAIFHLTLAGDSVNLAGIYPDIGDSYLKLNKLDSALSYQRQAQYYYSKLPPDGRKFEGSIYSSSGTIYEKMGNPDLARENYLKAVEVGALRDNPRHVGSACLQLANLYQSLNKADSSFLYARKALETFTLAGYKKELAAAYRFIADYYHDQKNTDSSFAYLRSATLLKDSLDMTEKAKLHEFQVAAFNQELQLQQTEQNRVEREGKLKTIAIIALIAVFSIIGLLLYRNNRQKQKANHILHEKNSEINRTLYELKATQAQLIQSEKMASLGELTAGIAHEIQNPLNFVNNFSEVNAELADELSIALKSGNSEEANALAEMIKDNQNKIGVHGKRAESIVKSMLQHSHASSGTKEPQDLNAMVDEYQRLAFHGLRAKDPSFQSDFTTTFDPSIGQVNVVQQDIARVLLNLINNAFYAVNEKRKLGVDGYLPSVHVSTSKQGNNVCISVRDNGNGITSTNIKKIFQPFFTTKPTGEGTGLGLSLSYDIVKAHGGEINVESKENEGTTFTIHLPLA